LSEKKKCKHVFNNEETHCTICMKPAWQIAHNNGEDYLENLKKDLKAALDYTTSWAKEFMNAETILKEHLEAHVKVSRDQLRNVDQLTVFVDFDESIEKQLAMLNTNIVAKEEMISVNRKELEKVFRALEGQKIEYIIIKNVLEPFYKKWVRE